MIITQTPFRVSFFGGGTDYPAWFEENGGAVLATSIDKYCFISIRYLPPFFEHRHRIVYSQVELINTVDEIKHPVVKAILNEMNPEKGIEIHHDGDLPARSGLGSSSSFAVGLLNAANALEGRRSTKQDLAQKAIFIEQTVLKENVGCQDQITTAHGGFNLVKFNTDGTTNLSPVIASPLNLEALQDSTMLFFTGLSRIASNIAGKKIENFKNRQSELRTMYQMVEEAMKILDRSENPVEAFGKLLHESWMLKRSLADAVSNKEIDDIYEAGINAGAYGGKLLGAGGGGFILFVAPKEKQAAIRKALKNLVHVNFNFENEGSKVLVYEPTELENGANH
jgi:D-glycero-alpha-D-manno-heptose-7-phosphate kinase